MTPRCSGLLLPLLLLACEEGGIVEGPTVAGVTIQVDVGDDLGPLPGHIDGTNGTSYSYRWDVDLAPACDEIGLTRFRIHDINGGEIPSPGDLPDVFADMEHGDPSDAGQYDFSRIDPLVTSAVDHGYTFLYRLGRSWGYDPLNPTADPVRWAEIAHRVILHYNEGWPDGEGFEYGIQDWEIFTEPDGHFWGGDLEQWLAFMEVAHGILDAYHPDLNIGCCGWIYNDEIREPFLEYTDERGVDLDFVSWHHYDGADPTTILDQATLWRDGMDAHGLADATSVLSEWGMWPGGAHPENGNAWGAAYYASSLSLLQEAPVDQVYRYRIDGLPDTFADDNGFSMINPDGTLKIPTLTFKAYKGLLDETPNRVSATADTSEAFYSVVAGVSEDRTVLQVVIGDLDSAHEDYALEVVGLPPGEETWSFERFVIGDDERLELVESEDLTADGRLEVARNLTAPQVQVLRWVAQEG